MKYLNKEIQVGEQYISRLATMCLLASAAYFQSVLPRNPLYIKCMRSMDQSAMIETKVKTCA